MFRISLLLLLGFSLNVLHPVYASEMNRRSDSNASSSSTQPPSITLKQGNIQPGVLNSSLSKLISDETAGGGLERSVDGNSVKDHQPRTFNRNVNNNGNTFMIPASDDTFPGRSILLAAGDSPQIAVAENGDIYVCVNTYDSGYSDFMMFYVYKSIDSGATWSIAGGAYSTTQDLLLPDIEVLADRFIVVYSIDYDDDGLDESLEYYFSLLDGTSYEFGTATTEISVGNEDIWWGSMLSDKFYYDINSTWIYVTFAKSVWDGTEWLNNIFYIHSEDLGSTWSDPTQVSMNNVGAFRPGIAIAYTTPDPGTSVDYVVTSWRDTLYNGYVGKIDVFTDVVTSEIILPSSAEDDGWGTWAPAISAYYENILVTSSMFWGPTNGNNTNTDIGITFSTDIGETWGEDAQWYYWGDIDDEAESNPTPVFANTGSLGFVWQKGDAINFRSNLTSSFLQGWNDPVSIAESVSNTGILGAAILNENFHSVYDNTDNFEVFYDVRELGTIEEGTLSGNISNALDGSSVSNALISIAGLSAISDASGNYSIENIPPGFLQASFSANPVTGDAPLIVQFLNQSSMGTQTAGISKEGFLDYTNSNVEIYNDQTTILNVSLSPILSDEDIRFVLNWGGAPSDLDIHLVTPPINGESHHVYWNNLGSENVSPYATLDNDVVSGYGPETMTIYDLQTGTYHLYIYNYSQLPDISTSAGVVQVYGTTGLIATIAVPTNDVGLYWNVCEVDGSTGNMTIINTLSDDVPAQLAADNQTNQKQTTRDLAWTWDFGEGNFSNLENPNHIYQYAGLYDVTLTITDGGNYSTTTRQAYITVISESIPEIEITFPIAGSVLQIMSSESVTWQSSDVGNFVKIEASKNGGSTWEILSESTTNDGAFIWNVPITWVDNSSCAIRISDSQNAVASSTSGIFGVLPTAEPQLLSVLDRPDDDGYFVDIVFTRSLYDNNSTGGSEIYTIWRLLDTGIWQAANSLDAGSQSLNNALGTTFEVGVPTNFKVTATMSEGTFTSSTFSGVSLDNLAPSVPTGLYSQIEGSGSLLTWESNSENDFAYYKIFRSTSSDTLMMQVVGESEISSFTDPENESYYYCVKAIDHSGNESGYSEVVGGMVAIDGLSELPSVYTLDQNYPNPFNPSTSLSYALPESANMSLIVYDIQGNIVKILQSGQHAAGWYEQRWDGVDDGGQPVSAGLYFAQLQTDSYSETVKMLMVK